MQDNKNINFLSHFSFKSVLYPFLSFVFALAVVLVFFFSVKFIVESIDRSFYEPSEDEIAGQIVVFDKANYLIVAKKLGIVVENQSGPATQTEKQLIATTTPEVLNKKDIKIAIYNSTKTAGLAAKLKALLIGEGFDVLETGTVSPALENTTIKIKDALLGSALTEEIKTLVGSKYQTTSQANTATSTFDAEIVIGEK